MSAPGQWRQASLSDVEGGILSTLRSIPATEDGPPGIDARTCRGSRSFCALIAIHAFSAGLEARLYGGQGCPPPRRGHPRVSACYRRHRRRESWRAHVGRRDCN